jgi:hypothetical protein
VSTSGQTSLRTEAVVGVSAAAYSVAFAGLLGVLWIHLAPQIDLLRAANGSEAAATALLGDDMWFGFLGILAGIVSVAVLLLVAKDAGRGPGGLLGLAVGGFAGSLLAAHLGHHVQTPRLVARLHEQAPKVTQPQVTAVIHYFDFLVRAKVVLLAWSVAAVLVHATSVVIHAIRFPNDY